MMQTDGSQLASSFREIHKNAWLKKVPSSNNSKLLPISQKKSSPERWWIVFCVHGDIEPYLEGYLDTSSATTHMPKWRISLKHTLHVSGSVGPARPHTEYEFVITLQESVVRLIAPTWESMQDWVDTLRNKLREMKIISPKENVYSKGPEQYKPRAPTRDPMSPLPPPPPGPIVYVPGTEPSMRPHTSTINDENNAQLSDITPENININENVEPNGSLSSENQLVNSAILNNTGDRIEIEVVNEPSTDNNENVEGNITEINSSITVDNSINIISTELTFTSNHCNEIEESLLNLKQHTNKNENAPSAISVSNANKYGECSLSISTSLNQNVDNVNQEICKMEGKLNNEKSPEFISNLANVSGMNICLGDKLLEYRMRTEGSGEFFTDFDTYDSETLNNELTKISINNNSNSKNEYSKVNINNKSKKVLIQGSSSTEISTSTDLSTTVIANPENAQFKPQVKPRIFINKDTNVTPSMSSVINIKSEGTSSVNYENNVININKKTYSSSNKKEKPKIIERKKIPYDGMSPDDSAVTSLKSVTIEPSNPDENVTIITVSNDNRSLLNTSHINLIDKKNQPVQSTSRLFPVSKVEECSYVNCEIMSNCENAKNSLESNVTEENGYGHIRQCTAFGIPASIKFEPSIASKQDGSNMHNNKKNLTNNEELSDDLRLCSPQPVKVLNIDEKIQNENLGVHIRSGQKMQPNVSNAESNANIVQRFKGQDFYESVFTSFSIPKPSSGHTSIDLNSTLCQTNSNEDTVNSNAVVNKKDCKNESNYEFLVWNENLSTVEKREPVGQVSLNNHNIPENACNVTSINVPSTKTQENLQRNPANNTTIKTDDHPKHGLFTRGLTELSIVSKFKNLGQPNSSRSPLLKNSQFYEELDSDEQQGTSSLDWRNHQENVKKNKMFTDKLNHLFGKISEEKSNKDKAITKIKNPSEKIKIESTLRRNWSEHNDRTMMPLVKQAVNFKPMKNTATPSEASSSNMVNSRISSDEQQIRRSNSFSEGRSNESNSTEHPKNSNTTIETNNSQFILKPMGLREQQVARLRGEMVHTGGVRLRLRSRDYPGEAMALADAYGTVWVCGWKQKTHPLLYNALHIGDRLVTVGGIAVTSVRQAKRALKDFSSTLHYVELVIKRLPHGKIYAIKKQSDTQDLGILTECATITGITPGSPAALGGVLPSGTLTEINGRPLNLLLKKGDTQVRDRLNSIGREISILVQPTEFVTLLKNSLRSIRGSKDYIVQ